MKKIQVAIFPDPERSLMAIPVLWRWEVPVENGFFVVGPLNVEGSPALPQGRWIFLAASEGVFLGEAKFETGVWPDQVTLVKFRGKIEGETQRLAGFELDALRTKKSEIETAVTELRKNSELALGSAKTRKAWLLFASHWRKTLDEASQNQQNLLRGPMFFPAVQAQVAKTFEALATVQDDFDYVSRNGAESLKKNRNKAVKTIWTELDQAIISLSSELSNPNLLAQVLPLSIDKEIVKQQILSSEVNDEP